MTIAPTTRKSLVKIKDTVAYYPHQITGVRDLARRSSFALCDEMGLGKTLQALTVAAIDFERAWAKRVLVVSPVSLKWNWLDEIHEFTNFTALVLDGSPKVRAEQLDIYAARDIDILIVNYEQVVAHKDRFNQMDFDIVIFDEAHYCKNYKSQRTKACTELKANRKFLLTGSPLLNQANELWPLLHMIDPGSYPNYWRFVSRYCVFGGYKDKQIVGTKNSKELTTKVQNVMLRRLKRDVLDLPDKQHIIVRVDLCPEQRTLYDQAQDEMKMDLPSSPTPVEMENALVKFLRLKQICGTTFAIDPDLGDHSWKLDRVYDMVEEITQTEHVVIFTQFRGVQAAIVERISKIKPGIPVYQLNGDTPMRERVPTVAAWGKDRPGAIVCMLQVAGVGLNMTQAKKCLFVDKLFVPKLNEQAEDRLHRIGADKSQPVQIFEMICRNTIENRIETILKRKKKLFDTLIEDQSNWKAELYKALMEKDETA
jgi:SNF2 family DNA or RNA helicase